MSKKNFKKKVKGAVKWGKTKYEEYQAYKTKAHARKVESRERSTKEVKSQVAYERAQNELARARAERRKINAPSATGGMGGGDIYSTLFGGGGSNSGGGSGGADVNAVLFGGPVTKTVPVKTEPVKKKYKYVTKKIPIKKARKRRTIKYRTVKRRVLVKSKKAKAMPAQQSQPNIVDMI